MACLQCDGHWHECNYCDWKPVGFIDSTASDEKLNRFLREHALDPIEKGEVDRACERIKQRLNASNN